MLIIGARGHAKEILDVLEYNLEYNEINFFDDINSDIPDKLFNQFPVLKNDTDVINLFVNKPHFILGLGGPYIRAAMCAKMEALGGTLVSVISTTSIIGKHNVVLGSGVNVMHNVLVSSNVIIGKGGLLNAHCLIHHDVEIGDFCEISPAAVITGEVKIGNFVSIGSGAIIKPKIKIGNNVIIGAGAVVTKDIKNNEIVVGVPAKSLN